MLSLRQKSVDRMEQLNMRGKPVFGFFRPAISEAPFCPIADGLETKNDPDIL
jgi:hypothetical protein